MREVGQARNVGTVVCVTSSEKARSPTQVRSDIFVINSDGTAERKLGDKLGASPRFAPDGKRIAFRVRAPSGEYARVWIMNADGSGAAPLAHGPRIGTAAGSGPAFSPDGRRIAYVGASPRRPGIYVMKADGTKRVRLTKHAGDATPVWRPVDRR
jgi:TolB protein